MADRPYLRAWREHRVYVLLLLLCLSSHPCQAAGSDSADRTPVEQPRTAFCTPTDRAPSIDGVLDDACWKTAVAADGFFRYETRTLARQRTQVQCAYDGAALYIAASAYSDNLGAMRTAASKRDSGVWQDDSVEIFLHPLGKVFYHFIVNSAGVIYDSRSDMKASKWNPPIQVACAKVRERGRSGRWTAELAVPWQDLGGPPKARDQWKANFTRTDSNRGELSTWSLIESGNFEQPKLFGTLSFRRPTPAEVASKQAWLKQLRQDEDLDEGEGLFSLPLNPGAWTTVKKLTVADCRVVRAFVGEPVDACTRSKNYSGSVREYPGHYVGAGINYSYNRNDGLHISLDRHQGFNAVVLRGGARSQMVADAADIVRPDSGKQLWQFRGSEDLEVAHLGEPVKSNQVSFFNTQRGSVADVAFYRIGRAQQPPQGATWTPRPGTVTLPEPAAKFAPENLSLALTEFYSEEDRKVLAMGAGLASQPLAVAKGKAVHFVSDPRAGGEGLAALGIEGVVERVQAPLAVELTVHDPLNPRRDLTHVRFSAKPSGSVLRLQVHLDIPDQVLLEGCRIWLTVRLDADVRLVEPRIHVHFVPKEQALGEALAWRKLLMRTLFGPLSEPRPWGYFKKQSKQEFYAVNTYAGQCPELFMTIDQCTALDPSDDLTRQYREWVYLRHLKELSPIDPPAGPPEGVPAWAWYGRNAWLEFRRMADWWMTERLVPTGEVGVGVQDDTDFYQQFADVPYFETGGVAAKVVDACERLAELAQKENLRGGLNRRATDSLHAYEEGINHLALMARWHYGDPIYLERCMESARNMEKLTILTEDGRRHFRDRSRMGFEDTQRPREPGIDGSANPLMWHTAFQLTDYNRNPKAMKMLREWGDTWLRFQKPGEYATAIEVTTGKVVSARKDRPLSGGYRSQAVSFLWLYALTGEAKYVEPFMHFLRQGRLPYPLNTLVADACALGMLDSLEAKARKKLAETGGIAALDVNGDPGPLIEQTIGRPRNYNSAIDTLHDARRYPDMYTTAHQYTDRVFLGRLQARASKFYLGGYCKRNKYNPLHAVSWEGFGTDHAALVLKNRRTTLKVAVYSFASKPMTGVMRIWWLEHGRYRVSVGLDSNGDFGADGAAETSERELTRGDGLDIVLQPKATTIVEISQLEKLDPFVKRADLAIAAREIFLDGSVLKGIVHNIGSTDAEEVVVAVVSTNGATLVRKSLGRLAAPLDLVPKRKAFELRLPRAREKGWRLVLDPEGKVPEIYEGNNSVALGGLPARDYSKGRE